MKFRRVRLADAQGHILGHNVSHAGRRVLKKGRRLTELELAELERLGTEQLFVAMLDPTDVEEDAAALRIAEAIGSRGPLVVEPAYGGRVSLRAPAYGVLSVDRERLLELNLLEGVTLATLPGHQVVAPRQHVATLKVIPFALPIETVDAAQAVALSGVLGFRELSPRRVAILVSGAASRRARLFEAYRAALAARVSALGAHIVSASYVALGEDPEHELSAAIRAELDGGVDLLILVGETATMDSSDLAPLAIGRAGGEVDVVGAPVFPGNLLLLAHRGRSIILGAPGCVRSRDANVVDLLLPRLLLGDRLGRREVAELAFGGLLLERPQPSAGADGASVPPEASEDG
jgi:molybdenum cofactor cytidylyltransferase